MTRTDGRDSEEDDMCKFGMVAIGEDGLEGSVLKPTRWMGNCPHILQRLARRCDRSHQHVQLVGGKAAQAVVYPFKLQEEICRGLGIQMKKDRMVVHRVDDGASGLHNQEVRLSKGGTTS